MTTEATSNILAAIKSFLEKTAHGIEQIADGIDDIENAFNTVSSDVVSRGKGILNRSKKKIDAIKNKGQSQKSTAISKIQEILAESKKGISIDQLMKKSGLNKKQVYNIVSKLKERGMLYAVSRGIYADTPDAEITSEAKKATTGKTAAKKTAKKKTAKKKAAKKRIKAKPKTTQNTNLDIVFGIIEKSGELSIKELESISPLKKKQLQNVIFKLKKTGRIISPRRGVYKAAE